MTTIAHISDVHLAPLPQVRPRDLLSKRVTGYLNWKLNRNRMLRTDTLGPLVEHMKTHAADTIAVTGDLVNLALHAEIERAGQWLKALGPAETVCTIPGNHDAYVRGAVTRALKTYGPYMSGETLDRNPFPFVRRVGQVALIGVSSAIPTPPFFAAGQVHGKQRQRLARILQLLKQEDCFRIVMIHHPPNPETARSHRLGLWKGEKLRRVIAEHGAEMILHGHTHLSTIHSIPGPEREVPVIGVAAGSAAPDGHDAPGRYNLFKIERLGTEWSCMMREYGYQRIGEEIALRLEMRVY